jgi:hypothetical protein
MFRTSPPLAPFPVLATLAMLALPSAALAESPQLAPAPFGAPPEGTRLVLEDLLSGGTASGVAVAPDGYILGWTSKGQTARSVTHFCPDCLQAGIGADGGPLAQLYPLEVGKGITFTRSRGDRTWLDEILVVGTDSITTPAGSFDTFVVRRRSKAPDDSWRAEQRNWYAPALGWVVKFEAFATDGRRQSWQLVAVD